MKKILIAASMAVFAISASAGVTAFSAYDYQRVNGSNTYTEARIGAAVDTKLGAFDATAVGARINTGTYDDALGFEVGYTNGLKLGPIGLQGRLGYGRLNQVNTVGGGFTGANTEYYSLAAEAVTPLMQNMSAFVGFRHRNGLDAQTPAANNAYSAGVDVMFGKVGVRVGATHVRQASEKFTGVITAVTYKF
jgi:hypothetical protein